MTPSGISSCAHALAELALDAAAAELLPAVLDQACRPARQKAAPPADWAAGCGLPASPLNTRDFFNFDSTGIDRKLTDYFGTCRCLDSSL